MLSMSMPLSGMQAASLQLSASASNIANMNSTGALPAPGQTLSGTPQPYQPVQAVQSAAGNAGAPGGTIATLRPVSPSSVAQYDPSASYANSQGLVAAPNVDLQNEAVNMATAEASFALNAKVAQAVNDMVKQLYDLGN